MSAGAATHRSGHVDSFARDNLPPPALQPDYLLGPPDFDYPERLNAVVELLDAHVAAGRGDRPCLVDDSGVLTYADVLARVDRIAHVLTRDLGLVPGNRVLLRAPNSPALVCAYLAVLKAGGVVVATMPLLRAGELAVLIEKARISLALCDARLSEEMEKAQRLAPDLKRTVYWDEGVGEGVDTLESLMAEAPAEPFPPCDTASDDVCLIGFTSGTTGVPKGTMHFQRDLLAICDGYGRHVLRAEPDDRFIGSPPLAFTFGLGGLVLFPMRVGASTVLLERAAPPDLAAAIERHRATVCFTAPTAYRAMLGAGRNLSSLRVCVSAGEALPRPVYDAWLAATGLKLRDGIGATEMLHIFISAPDEAIRPGSTGLPVPGYEARVVDEDGREVPRGTVGRLAVRGPTGCRYLADDRQRAYVQNGWNVTGDAYLQDADGYFHYQARTDDMIVSAGYNIAGPEVEVALLAHPAVAECGVVGAPDEERGMIVKAFVVPQPGHAPTPDLAKTLQDHVKATIAPYKYPREVVFLAELPKTATGKLQRFALRKMAEAPRAGAAS